jgi:hypothetical protein
VRRILLSVLLVEASGRPIGQGCWVDPMLGGRANTLGDVEAECPPEHHVLARLGRRVVGDAYRGS